MSFFITSVGPGNGADLGGLEGADAYCQQLADAAGAGGMRPGAPISAPRRRAARRRRTRATGSAQGPWQNADGRGGRGRASRTCTATNNLDKETALDENGEQVNGRGDEPNRHDILTGSQPDGTAFAAGEDRTCGNWTSSGDGAAMVGHHDRMGLRDDAPSKSWNSSHPSRGGCSQEALQGTGGDGLFYCFAAD